jgi:tetratricopeptide (TPR) repeat protein
MALYEALDRFVGAGLLASAGLVGAELPPGVRIDGAALSSFLRERRLGDDVGHALDALAHAIWLAQDQEGFPQTVCEQHAVALAGLLAEFKAPAAELAAAFEDARQRHAGQAAPQIEATLPPRQRLVESWLAHAQSAGLLRRAGLNEDVSRFLIELLFLHLIEQPRLIESLRPALKAFIAQAAGTVGGHQPNPAVDELRQTARTALPPSDPEVLSPPPLPPPQSESPDPTRPSAIVTHGPHQRLPEGALKRFRSMLGQQQMSAEHRLARLDELAEWLLATVAQLRAQRNEGGDLVRMKSLAADALEAGDLERAMDLLKDVRNRLRDERRRSESRLQEEMEALKAHMIEEASAVARLAELALARLDYDAAAELFADAASHLPRQQAAREIDYRQRQAEALAAKAEATGDPHALAAAAEAFRATLRLIDDAGDPVLRARIGVGLGDMLMALGARHRDSTAELEEAAAAYASALGLIDRGSAAMRWALVQLSHAAALMELGNRTERQRHWTAAATVLIPALEIFDMRGAIDLANSARAKLRILADGLDAPSMPALGRPAKTA